MHLKVVRGTVCCFARAKQLRMAGVMQDTVQSKWQGKKDRKFLPHIHFCVILLWKGCGVRAEICKGVIHILCRLFARAARTKVIRAKVV